MVKEYIQLKMELNMMVSGRLESIMVLGRSCGLMVAFIKESGVTVEKMVEVNSQAETVQFMKVNG